MRVASFYRTVPKESRNHFNTWIDLIGEALPLSLSNDVELCSTLSKSINVETNADVSYCQMFLNLSKRSNGFVYTFISDYRGYERRIRDWLIEFKPNLICMLQEMPKDLIEFVKSKNIQIELIPWFVRNKQLSNKEKTIDVMCSGCINPNHYPFRHKVFNWLKKSDISNKILSCNTKFGEYTLSNEEYENALESSFCFATGGIYDKLIPPKYYEIANNATVVVTHNMPFLEKCGFIDCKTCIVVSRIEEINDIVKLPKSMLKEIGSNAKKNDFENEHSRMSGNPNVGDI